jgi:hypothetical protein
MEFEHRRDTATFVVKNVNVGMLCGIGCGLGNG